MAGIERKRLDAYLPDPGTQFGDDFAENVRQSGGSLRDTLHCGKDECQD